MKCIIQSTIWGIRTFRGNISIEMRYGIGKMPKEDPKTMQATQSGGIHVYPNCFMSKYPYALNAKYEMAVITDEAM